MMTQGRHIGKIVITTDRSRLKVTPRTHSFAPIRGDATYLVHCDVPHHMEKGMKGQLVVGAGGETLPSVPRVSAALVPDRYPSDGAATPWWPAALAAGLGVALSLGLLRA